MNKTQEENLCRDIRRIAQGIERIAKAVEKKDGGEKVVIGNIGGEEECD